MAAKERRLPLEGVRVLDLTIVWAGPYTATLLADWGAEVIRIESIKHFQSTTRGLLAHPTPAMVNERGGLLAFPNREPGARPWNRSASFNANARNKLSMTVDMTRPEGQEVFDRLLRLSDGVIENNVPSVMERLGVTWERASAVNPRIILLRMPAFGVEGPYKDFRNYGNQMEAMAGHYSLMGYRDGDPSMTGLSLNADAASGLSGALAFLAGLRHQRRTGQGIFIEAVSTENFINLLGPFVLDYTMNGRLHGPLGNRHPVLAPHGVFPCRGTDRWLTIAVTCEEEWQALCRVTGRSDLAKDPRFATMEARKRNEDDLEAEIARWSREEDAPAAACRLQEEGVPAGVVMNERDATEDPHLQARGFWEPLTHPEAGTHLHPGILWKAERTPNHLRRAAPRLGEDNEYVYKGLLGFSDEEYRSFEETGHIGMDYDASIP